MKSALEQTGAGGAGEARPVAGALPLPAEVAANQFALVLRKLADELTYGVDASRFVGSGIDYAQSRAYSLGDTVKSIDWRVTARAGAVFVKQYEATKRSGLYLLIDVSNSMRASSVALSKCDCAVWAAGTLGLVGLRQRSPVAIVPCSDAFAGSMEPTLARGRLWAQLEALRGAAASAEVGRTTLCERMEQLQATAPHVANVVVVSDMHQPGAAMGVKRLAQRHDVTVLHLQDPAERGNLGAGFVLAQQAESEDGLIVTSRGALVPDDPELKSLPGAGVRYAVISTDGSGRGVIPAMRRVFGQRNFARGIR